MNMGTPGYVAPEVLHDFASASPASDVYSLGMILHELVTGVAPSLETPADLSLVPDLRGLPELVSRTLAPDPSNGPPTGRPLPTSWRPGWRPPTRPVLLFSPQPGHENLLPPSAMLR